MTIELSKLTPAPWEASVSYQQIVSADGTTVIEASDGFGVVCAADKMFIALARNAFDGDPEALAWWEANRRKRETEAET